MSQLKRGTIAHDARIAHADKSPSTLSTEELDGHTSATLAFQRIHRAIGKGSLEEIDEECQTLEWAMAASVSAKHLQGTGIPPQSTTLVADRPVFAQADTWMRRLWRAAYAADDNEYVGRVYSLQMMIVRLAVEKRAYQLFEIGLRATRDCLIPDYGGSRSLKYGVERSWDAIYWYGVCPLLDDSRRISEENALPFVQAVVTECLDFSQRALQDDLYREFSLSVKILCDLHDDFDKGIQHPGEEQPNHTMQLLHARGRLCLTALGGRAIDLQKKGLIRDATPYLQLIRPTVSSASHFDIDAGAKLISRDDPMRLRWRLWGLGDQGPGRSQVTLLQPGEYVELYYLWLFVTAISAEPAPTITTRQAEPLRRVLAEYQEELLSLSGIAPESHEIVLTTLEDILSAAETRATRGREDDIIARDIRDDLVERYRSAVANEYATPVSGGLIDSMRLAGRLRSVNEEDVGAPEIRRQTVHGRMKAGFLHFDDTYYVPDPQPSDLVRRLEQTLEHEIIEALERSPTMNAVAGTDHRAILGAIERALGELDPGRGLLVAAGNFSDDMVRVLLVDLQYWYQSPEQQYDEVTFAKALSLFRSNNVAFVQTGGPSFLYVIDASNWGEIVESKIGDQGVIINVDAITEERARHLLEAGRVAKDDLSDSEVVRLLQQQVEMEVMERRKLVVLDEEAARRIRLDHPYESGEVKAAVSLLGQQKGVKSLVETVGSDFNSDWGDG